MVCGTPSIRARPATARNPSECREGQTRVIRRAKTNAPVNHANDGMMTGAKTEQQTRRSARRA
jgi:hypothetical protein